MIRSTRAPYLVSGTGETGSAHLGRGTASFALRLERKGLREDGKDEGVRAPRGRMLQSDELDEFEPPQETDVMAKGQQRSNRETKKPKKDKAKAIAAAPSRKDAWQPEIGQGKKK